MLTIGLVPIFTFWKTSTSSPWRLWPISGYPDLTRSNNVYTTDIFGPKNTFSSISNFSWLRKMFSLPISVTDEITGSMVPRKISIYLQTNTYFRPRLSIDSSFFRGFKLAKRHHYHEVAAYFSTGYSWTLTFKKWGNVWPNHLLLSIPSGVNDENVSMKKNSTIYLWRFM